MGSDYGYGKRKEHQVGEFLQRRRFIWGRSQGSRGPYDILARRGSTTFAIQVKATRKLTISSTRLTKAEENKLLEICEGRRVTPVLALVSRNYVWLMRVTDGKILLEGRLKNLKYDYSDET